jgi:hypothetical protein
VKRPFESSLNIGALATTASKAPAHWYASYSTVRRLWAIEGSGGIRVIVALEPTHDGDDTSPVWFANCHAWAIELQAHLRRPVLWEQIDEASVEDIENDDGGVIVADLCWRDPCLFSN